jgi:biopolymer transport protein ExbD
MKIQTRYKQLMSLESIAMTDIIMNMFVFFFISFSLLYTFNPRQNSNIKVRLPEGATKTKQIKNEAIVVTVTDKNEIYLDNNKINQKNLLSDLKAYAGKTKKKSIVVRADKMAYVNYFVEVLDTAKQAGIDRISVSIELNDKKTKQQP